MFVGSSVVTLYLHAGDQRQDASMGRRIEGSKGRRLCDAVRPLNVPARVKQSLATFSRLSSASEIHPIGVAVPA